MSSEAWPMKLGTQGDRVNQLNAKAKKRYSKIAVEVDGVTPLKEDRYFGRGEQQFAEKWQLNSHRPVTGQITEDEFNFIVKGIDFPAKQVEIEPGHWIYTFPGSGANFDIGPSFEIGKYAQERCGIKHQPVYFQKGGYMGLLGGDSSFAYVNTTYDLYKSLAWLLKNNPDVQSALQLIVVEGKSPEQAIKSTNLMLMLSGYSQSADGVEDALEMLFGDGGFIHPGDEMQTPCPPGPYRELRGALRRVIQFGSPSRQPGQMSGVVGWNPKGWGISRKIRPEWLRRITVAITNPNDFYACVPDSDDIRPVFYAEIITASTKLPYFVHLLNVGIHVAAQWVPFAGLLLGGIMAPTALQSLGAMAKLGSRGVQELSGLFGQTRQASHDTDVDAQLVKLLSAQGVLTHLDDLVGLVADLPGLQNHGMYHLPFAELGNKSGIELGYNEIEMFYKVKG